MESFFTCDGLPLQQLSRAITGVSTADHNKEQGVFYSPGIRKGKRVRIHPRAAVEPTAGLSEDYSLLTAGEYIPFCTSQIQESCTVSIREFQLIQVREKGLK